MLPDRYALGRERPERNIVQALQGPAIDDVLFVHGSLDLDHVLGFAAIRVVGEQTGQGLVGVVLIARVVRGYPCLDGLVQGPAARSERR